MSRRMERQCIPTAATCINGLSPDRFINGWKRRICTSLAAMIIRNCQRWSRILKEVACVPACLCGCCHNRAVFRHHQMYGHIQPTLLTVKTNLINGLQLRTPCRDGSGPQNQLGKTMSFTRQAERTCQQHGTTQIMVLCITSPKYL